jgi:hypothetical protein
VRLPELACAGSIRFARGELLLRSFRINVHIGDCLSMVEDYESGELGGTVGGFSRLWRSPPVVLVTFDRVAAMWAAVARWMLGVRACKHCRQLPLRRSCMGWVLDLLLLALPGVGLGSVLLWFAQSQQLIAGQLHTAVQQGQPMDNAA